LTKVKNRHTSAVVGARSAVEETCRQVWEAGQPLHFVNAEIPYPF
jgi:hypothetical protein